MKKFLLSAIIFAIASASFAQTATTVTNSNSCFVTNNFNASSGGFSSPSIYSNADDVSFYWNQVAGEQIETSGLSTRSGSIISPIYNLTNAGSVNVGFKYITPLLGSYRIRIISAVTSLPLEILATTANGPVYTDFPSTSGTICLLMSDANLTLGRSVRFEFTYKASQLGNMHFDDFYASAAVNGPLAVTFEGFTARKNTDGSVKLLWNVGQEVNVNGYYPESSIDGINFTSIGFVTAVNKTIYDLDYTGKLPQIIYFRVRNLDIDGKSKYSAIIRVNSKEQANKSILLYPLPATNMVIVEHPSSVERASISLYSLQGNLLQQINIDPLTLQTQVNLNKLTKGIYIVKYITASGLTQNAKLIKN